MFDAVTYGAAVGAAKNSINAEKGTPGGLAELDNAGKVPSSQLPSYVDDVIEGYYRTVDGKFYADSSYTTEITGEAGKIYVSLDTEKCYRWSGTLFIVISTPDTVQSDWSQTNSSEKDFIKNKPPIQSGHGTGGNLEGGTSAYATYSNSFAYGNGANAIADYAFAFGLGLNAAHSNEAAFGKYNVSNADTAFSYGDGAPNGDNHNLMELKTDGTLFLNDNAVQTKNLATPLSISGTSQSTVESALGAISKKTSLLADINRNLGTEITAAQKLAIATGTFEDLPIGAYWTLNNTVYRIAHHDYYLGTGDTACTSHHIVIVPDNTMYSAAMNNSDTTAGGYAGSKMRTENLATALSTFETDFGVTHILNHRILITNAVSNEQANGWTWSNSKVDLMSENMVFGHPVWGQSGYETGIERGQLALFSLYPEFIQKQRIWYWLRSVGSESNFCSVYTGGYATHDRASYSLGVRSYACIYFDDVL